MNSKKALGEGILEKERNLVLKAEGMFLTLGDWEGRVTEAQQQLKNPSQTQITKAVGIAAAAGTEVATGLDDEDRTGISISSSRRSHVFRPLHRHTLPFQLGHDTHIYRSATTSKVDRVNTEKEIMSS